MKKEWLPCDLIKSLDDFDVNLIHIVQLQQKLDYLELILKLEEKEIRSGKTFFI